jgi:acetylornithine deacetylase/succinyl-diaminopimelate desuccinylase-like protein
MPNAPLDQLLEFLRFPSISTEPESAPQVAACADWLVEKFRAIGLDSAAFPTPGHPVVLARNLHREGRRTVLIYGHYDVQPVDPLELWTHPPFEPHVENGKIYARGATDNKGQILAHILGVEAALKKHGELPVNVIFLVEGEEEIGSPNLRLFLEEHREELRCDVIAISDTGMLAPGLPTFTYGLRGIAALEVKVKGPALDLHSGIFGGAIANPATMLARLVATLHDAEGRIAVEGFYDDVIDLQTWEREAWSKLPVSDAELLRLTGAPALFGEAGYTSTEQMWARPTAEVNGLGGGFQGQGSKTVIPKEAFVKLTFRLVPDQAPDEITARVRAHLLQHCPPGVTLEITAGHFGSAYVMNPHSLYGEAAQRALAATFQREVALIREGGSIPIVQTFKEVLGVETMLLGLALPDCRAHAPDENFPIENFEAGIRLNQALLAELAD